MRPDGYFRAVEPGDVEHVAERMRDADAQEVIASSGRTDIAAILARSVAASSHCWAGCAPDGEPVCLLGVAPLSLLGGIGAPWMLGTDRADEFPRAMVREGRRLIGEFQRLYPHLINYVDARNVRSIRWLRGLGFTVHPVEPCGPAGVPFHRFERCT